MEVTQQIFIGPTSLAGRLPPIPVADLESIEEDESSQSEVRATVNLYLMNKLNLGMGFPKQTVKHVLVNYKDIIHDDINVAIDFCIRAQENKLDEYLTDEEIFAYDQDESIGFTEDEDSDKNSQSFSDSINRK